MRITSSQTLRRKVSPSVPMAMIIAIGTEGDTFLRKVCDEVILIPDAPVYLSPILSVIPLQMLAYHIANELGCDVDKPRNLAKSVTVE